MVFKKDNSLIKSSQIGARVKNYENLFIKKDNLISFKSNNTTIKSVANKSQKISEKSTHKISDSISKKGFDLLEKILINEANYKLPLNSENLIPNSPGIYCIRIINKQNFPNSFSEILKTRNHNILYIGIATVSLKKRFLNQELRAKGHGTFFRSLGAILGYKPIKGSLLQKANKRNFKFSDKDEKLIINWINNNLKINWVESDSNLDELETKLILKYNPLINIAKNPNSVKQISDLRAECVKIANQI